MAEDQILLNLLAGLQHAGRRYGHLLPVSRNHPAVFLSNLVVALVKRIHRMSIHKFEGHSIVGRIPDIEFLPVKTVGETISSVADQRGCVGILMATAPTSEVALLTALSAIGKLRVRTSAAEA